MFPLDGNRFYPASHPASQHLYLIHVFTLVSDCYCGTGPDLLLDRIPHYVDLRTSAQASDINLANTLSSIKRQTIDQYTDSIGFNKLLGERSARVKMLHIYRCFLRDGREFMHTSNMYSSEDSKEWIKEWIEI